MKNGLRITMTNILVLCTIFSSGQGIWTQKTSFGGGAISEARAFSIGNFGYFGGPASALWRYDVATNSWSQMSSFIGTPLFSGAAFSIGGKGYLGTGAGLTDFYEYDTTTNAWTQLTNFGGSGREGAVGIAIDGKGYIGTGGGYLADWWEFDPVLNSWTQKANLSGPGRYHAGAFAVSGKGYVCTGFDGSFMNDLLEYDPVLNSWSTKTSMPGTTRDRPVGLSANNKGYLLTGWSGTVALADAWEYDPVTNSWTVLASMPTGGRYNSCGFSINNKLYIGTGYMNGNTDDFWEYGPDCSATLLAFPTSCALACDGSATVTDPAPAAVVSYFWSDGQTTATASGLCAATYTVTVTDTAGCVSINSISVQGAPPIPLFSQPTLPLCFGDPNGGLCIGVTGGNSGYSFLWSTGDTTDCTGPIPAGLYVVTVTDSTGCQGSISIPLNEPGLLVMNINGTDATCSTCNNGSATAQVAGGTPTMTYLWSTGATLAFVNNLLPGTYTCCVTDFNGCSTCDTVVINFPSGIEEAETNSLIVSPNPFISSFAITWNREFDLVEDIWLVDMAGRKVSVRWQYFDREINVSAEGLQNGNYILMVRSNSNIFPLRINKGD